MARVIGYRPHEDPALPGAVFQTDDGKDFYAFGDEAKSLQAHLDATRPPDPRLAMGATPDDRDAIMGMVAADNAPPAAHGAPPPTATDGTHAPPPVPQPATPPGVSPAVAQAQDLATQRATEYLQKGQYRAPTPRVTPEQLQAKAGQGVPIATTRTVSGLLNETPEQKREREETEKAHDTQREALQSEFSAAQEERLTAAKARETAAFNEAARADLDRRETLQRARDVETEVDRTNVRLQRENDAAAKLAIDPDRLFKEKGTLGRIQDTVALAFGAFGASLTHSPNFAQEMIKAEIDRDIASQMDEIQAKRSNAQNTIANYAKTYGMKLGEAQAAAKEAKYRYTAALVGLQAAQEQRADARAAAAKAQMDLLAQAEAIAAERVAQTRGRATEQYAMQYPQAGSPGGWSGPTMAGVAQASGVVKGVADAQTQAAKASEGDKGGEKKTAQQLAYVDAYERNTSELKELGLTVLSPAKSKRKALLEEDNRRLAEKINESRPRGKQGEQDIALRSGAGGFIDDVTGANDAQLEENLRWAERQRERLQTTGAGPTQRAEAETVPGATDVEDEEE